MFHAHRLFLIIFLLIEVVASAQSNNHSIEFNPKFGNEKLTAGHYFMLNKDDSISITELKFYISAIQLIGEKEEVVNEENSYHLINFSDTSSLRIVFKGNIEKLKQIRFKIGVDSLANVSGALGGQLDPTLGMYWTWQSGYINFKLEGASNLCNTRKNEFTFHLGGYQGPDKTIQEVSIDCSQLSSGEKISIDLDVRKFLAAIELPSLNHIMSPGKEAVRLSNLLPTLFSLQKK